MMFTKKNLHSGLFTLIIFFLFGLSMPVDATMHTLQDEQDVEFKYEDEDLIKFVAANQEISALRREVNNDISEIVTEAGLTMDRFNQIARAAQIGALDEGAFSSEEIMAFNEVAPLVNDLRQQMSGMTSAILAERGITPELYQEILADYRQDHDMQEYVRELLRERAREKAFEKRKQQLIEEKGLTEEEAEELIIRRSEKEERDN